MFAIAGEPFYFKVNSVSCSKKEHLSGADNFVIFFHSKEYIDDVGRSVIVPVSPFQGDCTYSGDLTHDCVVNITKAGSYKFDAYQLVARGLLGHYFYDSFLSSDAIENIRVDALLNFTWLEGKVSSSRVDFVSIRWEGFVKSQFSELYKIISNFDDSVRIWLDHNLIIDTWDRDDVLKSALYYLDENIFYPIVIEYYEIDGNATAQIFWESQSTPLQIIPSSAFYYKVSYLCFIPIS